MGGFGESSRDLSPGEGWKMGLKHRARLQLGFWGLIWPPEHGRDFGGAPGSVGSSG